MAQKLNLEDKRFGRLLVIEEVIPKMHKYVEYKCICDCGKKVIVKAGHLTAGRTKSCGCFQKENARIINSKPYNINSKEYKIWSGIKRRCYNKKDKSYHKYGGKGLGMSIEWRLSFEKFIEDMGNCPLNLQSIDRIDNSKGYEKGNCRWADYTQQANNRSTNIFFTYNGITDTLSNICRIYNVSYKMVWRRIKNGLDIETAINLPKQFSTKKLIKLQWKNS